MNAPIVRSKIDRVRERDGDHCWLCDVEFDFNAAPNSKKSATIEHLHARSNGGSDKLDNLVLCHPGCNRQLGDRPKADKLKMREKRIAKRAKESAPFKVAPKVIPAKPTAIKPSGATAPFKPPQRDWQRTAIIAIASATFFAGLSLGILIG